MAAQPSLNRLAIGLCAFSFRLFANMWSQDVRATPTVNGPGQSAPALTVSRFIAVKKLQSFQTRVTWHPMRQVPPRKEGDFAIRNLQHRARRLESGFLKLPRRVFLRSLDQGGISRRVDGFRDFIRKADEPISTRSGPLA